MSRVHAATTHLAICAVVATVLVGLFWFIWYPQPLLIAVGGQQLFFLLLGVDVALGPLLTFIVFKAGKKSLKFDLTAIGVVQVIALSYGVHTRLIGRPVYIASLGNRFVVIQANEVQDQELTTAKKSLPWFGPQWVGTKEPADKSESERILFGGLGGAGYDNFPLHHAPLESMRDEILKNAVSLSVLRKNNPTLNAEITAWLHDRGYSDEAVCYQALIARAQNMSVILDAKTAKVIGIAPFKPRG